MKWVLISSPEASALIQAGAGMQFGTNRSVGRIAAGPHL